MKGTNFSLFDDLLYWAFDHLFEVDLVQNIGLFVVVDFSLEVTQIFAVSQYIFQYENLEVWSAKTRKCAKMSTLLLI